MAKNKEAKLDWDNKHLRYHESKRTQLLKRRNHILKENGEVFDFGAWETSMEVVERLLGGLKR